MNAAELLPALRDLYSRLPEMYFRQPWELQHVLFSLGYTDDLAEEAEIASEALRARGAQLAASRKQVDLHNARLSKLLSEVGAELEARALARGMIEWITELPHGFKPVRHEQGGLSEQTALNVLVASLEDAGGSEAEGAA